MPQGNYPHNIFIEFPFVADEARGNNILLVPVPPEQLVSSIDGILVKHSLVSLGEVLSQGARRLQSLSWESHFPQLYDPYIEVAMFTEHVVGRVWNDAFKRVMDEKSVVHISIDNFPLDLEMAVESFKPSVVPGPYGDLWYQVTFVENREGLIRVVSGTTIPTTGFRPRPYGDLPKSYKVQPNQSLQDISSLLYYGDMQYWVDLLDVNFSAILAPRFLDQLEQNGGDPDALVAASYVRAHLQDYWSAADIVPAGIILAVPVPKTLLSPR